MMSTLPRPKGKSRSLLLNSNFLMIRVQRLRRSWIRLRLTSLRQKQRKAAQRALLLQLETSHQHLRVKELGQLMQQLEHRQQEMAEAEQWAVAKRPSPPGLMPPR